jgi:DNA invertase Pin-like site-specific DNA recombinase
MFVLKLNKTEYINMKNTDYVVYYRASTEKQEDGLGLDAQKTAIERFIKNYGGKVTKEVKEIISGSSSIRLGFNEALDYAKTTGATLLVHRIDRLSRSGFMTIALLEQEKVPFIEADAPNDSAFSKNIKFLVAKEEREKLQSRVTDALSEIKSKIEKKGYHISKSGNRITSLGSPQNLSQDGRARSIETRRLKALHNPNNKRAYGMVKMLSEKTLKQTADFLNENGFPTSTGKNFTPMAVSNLKKLYS